MSPSPPPTVFTTFLKDHEWLGEDVLLAWVEFVHVDATGAPNTYSWSGFAPIALDGVYREPRVLTFGTYERKLSDRTGRLESANCAFQLGDVDNLLRGFLGNPWQLPLVNVEVTIKLSTKADYLAGVNPFVYFQGLVQNYKPGSGFTFEFDCWDWLSEKINKPLPLPLLADTFISVPDANLERVGPVWYGHMSNGGSSHGPVQWVANPAFGFMPSWTAGFAPKGGTPPTAVSAVENLGAGTLAGGRTFYVGVTSVTAAGDESDPDILNPANWTTITTSSSGSAITVSWTPAIGAAIYRAYIGVSYFGVRLQYYLETSGTSVQFTAVADYPTEISNPTNSTIAAQFGNSLIYHYVITAIMLDGETPISAVVTGVTSQLLQPFYMQWAAVPGAIEYHIYRAPAGQYAAPNGSGFRWQFRVAPSATSFIDDFSLSTATLIKGLPATTGVVPCVYVGQYPDEMGGVWEWFVIACHAIREFYGAWVDEDDGAGGRMRTHVDPAQFGVDWLTPRMPGWTTYFPSQNHLYYDAADGTRWTLILTRSGQTSVDLAQGVSQLWVNIDGVEDIGNGLGNLITNGVMQIAHLEDNFILTNFPYGGGTWALGPPQWANSTDKRDVTLYLRTAAAAAASFIPDRAWGVISPLSIVDVEARLSFSTDTAYGWSHDGKLRRVLEPPDYTGPLPVADFTEINEIAADTFGITDITDPGAFFNRMPYEFAPVYGVNGGITYPAPDVVSDVVAQFLFFHRHVVPASEMASFYAIQALSQVLTIRSRKLNRAILPTRDVAYQTGLHALSAVELGDYARTTHREGIGPTGYHLAQMQVRGIQGIVDTAGVMLTLRDLRRGTATTTTVNCITLSCVPMATQTVTWTAIVLDSNGNLALEGEVTFTVVDASNTIVGATPTAPVLAGLQFLADSDWLFRTFSTIDYGSDWTRFIFAGFTGGATSYATISVFGNTNLAYNTPYIGVFIDPLTQRAVTLKLYDGAVLHTATSTSVISSVGMLAIALRYTAATTTLELIINGLVEGSIVYDLSTLAFGTLDKLANNTLSKAAVSLTRERSWQAALSTAELTREAISRTAVRLADLLSDSPLETASDLSELTVGNDWSAAGSVIDRTSRAEVEWVLPAGYGCTFGAVLRVIAHFLGTSSAAASVGTCTLTVVTIPLPVPTGSTLCTDAVLGSAPYHAAGVTVFPSGSPWANSPWVKVFTTTTTIALTNLIWNQPGWGWTGFMVEFDVAIGAAGSEVVIGTLAAWAGFDLFTGMNEVAFPIPYGSIPPGTPISVRIRKAGTDTGAWEVTLAYFTISALNTLPLLSSTGPIAVPPGGSTLVTPSSSAWGNSSWVEVDPAIAAAWTIAAVTTDGNVDNANSMYEVDVGYGPAGAEIVFTTVRGDNAGNFWGMGPSVIYLNPLAAEIPLGSRVSVRLRKQGTDTTRIWKIRMMVYPGLTSAAAVTHNPQRMLPSAADSLILPGTGVGWTNGAWVQFIASTPVATSVVAICIAGTLDAEIDIGTGAAGFEVVRSTERFGGIVQDRGCESTYTLCLGLTIPAGQRIACRLRSRGGTDLRVALTLIDSPDYVYQSSNGEVSWPAAANSVSVAGSTTPWVPSAWAELIASAPANSAITSISYTPGAGDIDADIEIGVGPVGFEVLRASWRVYGEGNSTSHASRRKLPIPLCLTGGDRVAIRVNKAGTGPGFWHFAATAMVMP